MSEDRWTVTDVALVVRGPDVVPSTITEQLGIEPTSQRPPGPDKWDPTGDTSGIWKLQFDERTSREPSGQLDALLTALSGKADVLEAIADGGHRVHIRLHGYVGNGSRILLPSNQMARLRELGVPLEISANTNER